MQEEPLKPRLIDPLNPLQKIIYKLFSGLTNLFCWLTGKSNYDLIRAVSYLAPFGVLIHSAVLWNSSPFTAAFFAVMAALYFFAALILKIHEVQIERHQHYTKMGYVMTPPSLNLSTGLCCYWFFCIAIEFPLAPLPVALFLWSGIDYILMCHNEGGKSAFAKAKDKVAAIELPRLSLPQPVGT